MEKEGEQCSVYAQGAVVIDEAQLLKRFIKKLTRDRVVPTISARVPWLTFRLAGCGLVRPKTREQQESSRQPPSRWN